MLIGCSRRCVQRAGRGLITAGAPGRPAGFPLQRFLKERCRGLARYRLGKKEPLSNVASEQLQPPELLLSLHALGYHPLAQVVSDGDYRRGDGVVAGVLVDLSDD